MKALVGFILVSVLIAFLAALVIWLLFRNSMRVEFGEVLAGALLGMCAGSFLVILIKLAIQLLGGG